VLSFVFRIFVVVKVGMVVNETLRCFPSAPMITRSAAKDLQLKGLFVPKGMEIEFAVAVVHQDKEYWGEDVAEFNPGRFERGISAACSHPQAFVPFGMGPKFCIGNNFATMEMKIIVARVLQRFQLLPSPNYKHHPTAVVVLRPKYGMPIILKAL
jgi:cytochrome P450